MKDSIRLVDIAFFVENLLALVTRFFPLSQTVAKDRDILGMNSWERAKIVAKDRDIWRQRIRALYATGREEDM
jgi:hypothetical protein